MRLTATACAAMLTLTTAQAAANCPRFADVAGPRPLTHPMTSEVTGVFGLRRNGFTGFFNAHAGLDYAGRIGDPVMSAAPGEVIHVARQEGLGLLVMIDHPEIGVATVYAHLERADVTVGACVMRGQIIGAVGQSGRATGPRLHFEVRGAIDPGPLLGSQGVGPTQEQ